MKFYYPNKEYLDYLRKKADNRIMNVEGYCHSKFIFGILFEIFDYQYYVPVSSVKETYLEKDGTLKSKYKKFCIPIIGTNKREDGTSEGKILALLRFNYMFPVPKEEVNELNFDEVKDLNYKNLLQKEYLFCKTNFEQIQKKAKSVYKIGKNPKHFLSSACCNFSLIETEYMNWLKNRGER
jgi:protein AbiQ